MLKNVPPELEDKFKSCKEKVMAQGNDESSAYGICYAAVVEGKAEAIVSAAKAGFILDTDTLKLAAKLEAMPIKAVGEWELDVTVLPFKKDSDGQWFDDGTDIMENAFTTPLVIYQHGVKQGARALDSKPLIIAKSIPGTLRKMSDGWHINVILDKALKQAKDIMDAAWKGMVAVSSDSIAHLARLEVGGKLIQYEKNRPGRIAVWPLAAFSMWEKGNGNFEPANHSAIALPAMKAIYRDAGLPFPELKNNADDTHGELPEAEKAAKRAKIVQQAKAYLSTIDE